MTSPVSAIEAIEKAMEGVTPGGWILGPFDMVWHADDIEHHDGKWREKVPEPRIIASASKGSLLPYEDRANAAYIAACSPDQMREVLALARKAEALQRENAELRKALKPLAAEADCWSSAYPDTCLVARTSKISLGTIRRARALLGGENAGN